MKTIIKRNGIEYRYEKPWIVEVEGDHDNEPVVVDISKHNWKDIDDFIQAIHDEMKLNDLFTLSGNSFIADSKWVAKNDPEVYRILSEMLEDFADDEYNTIDNEDVIDFYKGKWVVEYTFRMGNRRQLLVSAGRDHCHAAQQPAWIYCFDGFGGADFSLLPLDIYIQSLKSLERSKKDEINRNCEEN